MDDLVEALLEELPPPPRTDTHRWATVTATSPLQVRVDGDTAALAFAPDVLAHVLPVNVGDRVLCLFAAGAGAARYVTIIGRRA